MQKYLDQIALFFEQLFQSGFEIFFSLLPLVFLCIGFRIVLLSVWPIKNKKKGSGSSLFSIPGRIITGMFYLIATLFSGITRFGFGAGRHVRKPRVVHRRERGSGDFKKKRKQSKILYDGQSKRKKSVS